MLKQMCMKCFDIYAYRHNVKHNEECPKIMCDGELVQIDDLIIPVIITLNHKKYTTTYCCSGHITEPCGFIGAYIKFTEESFDKLIKNNPPPKYWHYDDHYSMRLDVDINALCEYNTNSTGYRNLTKEFMKKYRDKFTNLTQGLESLYNWSDNLK